MQSGYGGVSEFQQFIMDGGFAMSAPAPQQHQPGQPPAGQELGGPFRYQPLHHHAHSMPPHFAHFAAAPPPPPAGIPFTQQLLHQAQAAAAAGHQLQLFHEQQHHKPPQQPVPARWAPQHHHQQQQAQAQAQGHHHQNQHHHLGFDVEAVPESSGAAGTGSAGSGGAAPPGVPSFLAAAMNFKLAVDAGGGSGATDGGGGAGSGMMLHVGGGGDEEAATESRLRRWAGDEETSIKEPSWRPLDIDYLHSASSSKRLPGKEKVATPESPAPPTNYFSKKGGDDNAAAAAVAAAAGGNYKLFSELEAIYKPGSSGCAQTGSGSGLTGDDNANILDPPPGMGDLPGVADAPQLNTSETSAGEEPAAAAAVQPPQQQRKRKRRRQEHQVSASASFFERLVQRLMEHQESLHRQFLDAMERRERERAARDEAWRRQEADKFAREAAARAQDRASAAAREQAIVTYLEKISGETILLPPPAGDDDTTAGKELVPYEPSQQQLTIMSGGGGSRWPKQEVEALIRVRTGLEGRFQEPGLKGPLWEEVSSRMAAAGYGRSAKRCKEKWENINKYFRKAKESGKKRPKHAKTCPYFDDLDKLYSRTNANADASNSSKPGSELLDAVVVKYPADAHAVPPGFSAAADGDDDGDGKGRAAADDHHDQDQDDEVSESHAHDDDE